MNKKLLFSFFIVVFLILMQPVNSCVESEAVKNNMKIRRADILLKNFYDIAYKQTLKIKDKNPELFNNIRDKLKIISDNSYDICDRLEVAYLCFTLILLSTFFTIFRRITVIPILCIMEIIVVIADSNGCEWVNN